MRIVLWATYAKPELIGRLKPLLGDNLVMVANPEELGAAIGEADALLCPDFLYGAQLAGTVRAQAGRLRWLQLLTQGFENVQAQGVPAGVTVSNAGDAYSPAVAMHAPHVAGAAGKAGFDRLADVAAGNVERFLAGEPLGHVVMRTDQGADP